MSSYKQLNKADVTTVNYHANKHWNLYYTSSINDRYAVASIGKNEPFNITGSTTTNGQYRSLLYSEINHLFYQAYSGSLLNTSSLMMHPTAYISASQQRPTASYFNYNDNPLLIKQFPTGAGETINVLSINQSTYGSKLLPQTFIISSSNDIFIKDDGYGNLYSIGGALNQYIDLGYVTSTYFSSGSILPIGVEFIGNIFYAHGIAVITHQEYQDLSCLNVNGGFFQNLDGWDISDSPPWISISSGNYWIWDNGRLAYNFDDSGAYAYQDILTVGKTYRITFDLEILDTGDGLNKYARVYAGTAASADFNIIGTSYVDVTLTCTSNTYFTILGVDSDGSPGYNHIFIDNVCVTEVI